MKKNQETTLSEEEIEENEKMVSQILDMKELSSVYHIDRQVSITTGKVSSKFYIDNLILSTIMESFYNGNECSYKDFNNCIYERFPKWTWRLKLSTIDNKNAVSKLIRLGFIEYVGLEGKYNPKFKITDNGIKALREQTFQILAASSFFSHQTYLINKRSFWLTIIMLIVTILSVIVTIKSLNKSEGHRTEPTAANRVDGPAR